MQEKFKKLWDWFGHADQAYSAATFGKWVLGGLGMSGASWIISLPLPFIVLSGLITFAVGLIISNQWAWRKGQAKKGKAIETTADTPSIGAEVSDTIMVEIRSYLFRSPHQVGLSVDHIVLELGVDVFVSLPISCTNLELQVGSTFLSPVQQVEFPGGRISQDQGLSVQFDIPKSLAIGQSNARIWVVAGGKALSSQSVQINFEKKQTLDTTFKMLLVLCIPHFLS